MSEDIVCMKIHPKGVNEYRRPINQVNCWDTLRAPMEIGQSAATTSHEVRFNDYRKAS